METVTNLSLVIPLYNESSRLNILEQGLLDFNKNPHDLTYEIILVNDGSDDNTGTMLEDLRKRFLEAKTDKLTHFEIIHLPRNLGKGGALREGVFKAEGQWILTLDADMATSPLEVLNWSEHHKLDLHSKPDRTIFIGSREHPDSTVNDKAFRRVIGRVFNLSIQFINGLDLNDTQCGFKLYPTPIAKSLFEVLKDFGWAHDVELLKNAKNRQIAIMALPIQWHFVEENKIRPLSDAFPMFFSLLKLEYATLKNELWPIFSNEKRSKEHFYHWIFCGELLTILAIVLYIFHDFGVTWDEPLQNQYGRLVLKYYSSLFSDRSAFTYENLYFYGGLFDSTVSFLIPLFPFGEFETRHLLNAFVGVAGIMGTWKIANLLAGSRAALLSVTFLILEPFYFGNMFNNPKDIPFAVGYVWSLYYLILILRYFPKIPNGLIVKCGIVIGLTLGVRVGGFLLLAYLGLAAMIYCGAPGWFSEKPVKILQPVQWLKALGISVLGIFLLAYGVMLLFWPWAQVSPFIRPFEALSFISQFQGGPEVVLLAGKWLSTFDLPASYLPHYFSIKLSEPLLAGLGLSIAVGVHFLIKRNFAKHKFKVIQYTFLVFAILFPVTYVILKKSILYDTIRHFLFIMPCLCIISGIAFNKVLLIFPQKQWWGKSGISILLMLAFVPQVAAIIQLHPNQYVYYNSFVNGLAGANRNYEMDYWANSYKEAVELLTDYLKHKDSAQFQQKTYTIAVCGPWFSAEYYFPDNFKIEPDFQKADFLISFTRFNCDQVPLGGRIAAVKRMGVELSVIKDLKSLN